MRKKKEQRPPLETVREQKKYNPLLIFATQPAGNLNYGDERYIKTGDGYVTCIQVYEYPGMAYDFWMSNLMKIDGVYTTVDIATQDREAAENDLSRSLNELSDRNRHAQNAGELIEDTNDQQHLEELLASVKIQGEEIKVILTRIYVAARTTQEVDHKVNEVISMLESQEYRAAVFLNETEYQYRALFTPYTVQSKQKNKRVGVPIPAHSLAGGYPFNYEEIDDDCGQYIGSTETDGVVILDTFTKSKLRLSYDFLLVGKKGSGKSTTLKMLLENVAISENYIRVIDKTGEFTDVAQMLGGKVVTMNGTEGTINYLQVFRVSEHETENFSAHLSKLNTFYKFIKPDADTSERNEFEEYVRKLYEVRGYWDSESNCGQVTGLPEADYPVFPELLELVRKDLYEDPESGLISRMISPSRMQRLESIELTIGNLVHSYPLLFCSTTTIPAMEQEKIVVYNVKGLSNLKPEIFNAQLFNILNLMLDDMIRIGAPSKRAYEEGTPISDITKLLLMIDEAHEFINTNNPLVLDFMIRIVREGRKYFTGLGFASQSIRDFAPDASGEAVEKLKILFELCQYKFIMKQDGNALDLIRRIFEQELTESQIQLIPGFEQGECLLLTGEQTVHLYVEPTDEELKMFRGGA